MDGVPSCCRHLEPNTGYKQRFLRSYCALFRAKLVATWYSPSSFGDNSFKCPLRHVYKHSVETSSLPTRFATRYSNDWTCSTYSYKGGNGFKVSVAILIQSKISKCTAFPSVDSVLGQPRLGYGVDQLH